MNVLSQSKRRPLLEPVPVVAEDLLSEHVELFVPVEAELAVFASRLRDLTGEHPLLLLASVLLLAPALSSELGSFSGFFVAGVLRFAVRSSLVWLSSSGIGWFKMVVVEPPAMR